MVISAIPWTWTIWPSAKNTLVASSSLNGWTGSFSLRTKSALMHETLAPESIKQKAVRFLICTVIVFLCRAILSVCALILFLIPTDFCGRREANSYVWPKLPLVDLQTDCKWPLNPQLKQVTPFARQKLWAAWIPPQLLQDDWTVERQEDCW